MRKIAVFVAMCVVSFLNGFGTSRLTQVAVARIPNPIVQLAVYLVMSTGVMLLIQHKVIDPIARRLLLWAQNADRLAAERKANARRVAASFAHPAV